MYIESVNKGTPFPPPTIEIEIFFDGSIDAEYEGNENSERLSCEGLKFEIAFNEKYSNEYNTLIAKKNGLQAPSNTFLKTSNILVAP